MHPATTLVKDVAFPFCQSHNLLLLQNAIFNDASEGGKVGVGRIKVGVNVIVGVAVGVNVNVGNGDAGGGYGVLEPEVEVCGITGGGYGILVSGFGV